jgi:putative transcriptional regulator
MKKTKNSVFEAVTETASEFERLGFIDKHRLKQIQALCIEEVPHYTADYIRALRAKLQLSQAVLANLLNISPSTVRKWEQGEKNPSGASLKLLWLLDRRGLQAVL